MTAPFVERIERRLPERYILNKRHGVAHDRTRLKERCNTDDISRSNRRASDHIPEGYRRCEWCLPEETS
jgi:hypothetical protein